MKPRGGRHHCLRMTVWACALAAFAMGIAAQEAGGRMEERAAMVRDQILARGVADHEVLDAMLAVPRHEFMPPGVRDRAYGDHPLPIGHGQTISQPYIVAHMTERLELEPGDRVLEIGSGSAYQAAVLAEIASDVCTVEIIPALAEHTDRTLARLGYDHVQRRQGDGYFGWPEEAPFDAIIVTAAASHVPPPLVEQLAPGGRMLVPVGETPWSQNLVLVTKTASDEIRTRTLIPVRFVPLTGGH